jgi:NAD(P)-dependent dehydrogenase (short-subunit alcohol dehydrogenase family)
MLRGVALGTKHAARAIKAGGRGGVIINTSSVAGITANCSSHGDPVYVAAGYTAAKHGVVALTRLAACELAPYRIRVNAVAPGQQRGGPGHARVLSPSLPRCCAAYFIAHGIFCTHIERRCAFTPVVQATPPRR